jgi:hypothetical protein
VTCTGCGQYQSGHPTGLCWNCRDHTWLEERLKVERAKDEVARRERLRRERPALEFASGERIEVEPVPALSEFEIHVAVGRLLATAPNLRAVARIVDPDGLARLCRETLQDQDIDQQGWRLKPRWFGVVVESTPKQPRTPTGAVIEWPVFAAQLRRQIASARRQVTPRGLT